MDLSPPLSKISRTLKTPTKLQPSQPADRVAVLFPSSSDEPRSLSPKSPPDLPTRRKPEPTPSSRRIRPSRTSRRPRRSKRSKKRCVRFPPNLPPCEKIADDARAGGEAEARGTASRAGEEPGRHVQHHHRRYSFSCVRHWRYRSLRWQPGEQRCPIGAWRRPIGGDDLARAAAGAGQAGSTGGMSGESGWSLLSL